LSSKSITYLATGELILGMSEPSPEFYFEMVAPTLRSADLVVAHLEVAHTTRPAAPGAMTAPPPENMRGIPYAGISAVTLAGNAIMAYGVPGVIDTIDWLKKHNIPYSGAGMNIDEARRPLIIERDGVRFGFLSFNGVSGPQSGATSTRPGNAYVDIITHYEPGFFPGDNPKIFTFPEHYSLEAMREDIRSLRPKCDVLSVALHMGGAMTEIVLQDYEFELPYAAIEAGADIILGGHTHALRGVEFYKGKPIFHCLCNLVTVFPWESHQMFKEPEPLTLLTRSKLRSRGGHARSWMDLSYPYYPFPVWSRKSIIAKFNIEKGKIARISYLPVLINKQGQPEILKKDARGQEVFDYMEKITRAAGLNAHYEWEGDEVVIHD
jgi:hypothetical protein